MQKRKIVLPVALGIVSLIVLILSLSFVLGDIAARGLTRTAVLSGHPGGTVGSVPCATQVTVSIPHSTITDRESEVITFSFVPYTGCLAVHKGFGPAPAPAVATMAILIDAPDVDIQPASPVIMSVNNGEPTTFTMVCAPQKTGSYTIHVYSQLWTATFKLNVTNSLGFDATKELLLSYIFSVAGAIGVIVSIVTGLYRVYKWVHGRRMVHA